MARREWTQAERLRDRLRRQADASRETFHGTHRGASLVSSPTGRTARGSVPPVTIRGGGTHPATILVTADNWEVFNDFEGPVEFTDAPVRNLVDWSGPSDEIVWPVGGTIMLYVEGAWDDLEPADATVEVLIGDAIVWHVSANSLADGVVLVLQAEDVSVPHATDVDVEFTTAVEQERIGWAGPSDEVVWPVPGVVKFDVAGRWADADPNPNVDIEIVQVRVDDGPVWPPSWLPLPGTEVS